MALEAAPDRRMAAERRLPPENEAGALQVAQDALGGNGGHVFGGVVPLSSRGTGLTRARRKACRSGRVPAHPALELIGPKDVFCR